MRVPATEILAAAAPPGGAQPNFLVSLLPFVLIAVVFYFVLIAPARRKQKKVAEMLANLKPGDRVVTSGGIYGTIVAVSEGVVQLRVADQVKIEVARHAIAGLQQQDA